MGLFDKLLESVAESDREVLKKYPVLAEKVNELDGYVGQWEKWKANNWDAENGMTKAAVEALKQKDAEIEALKAMQEGDMDWDGIKTNIETLLASKNLVTRDQFEKELIGKMPFVKPDDLKQVSTQVSNLERGMEATYAKTAHLPLKYHKEFGNLKDAPEFTAEALFKHMTDNKLVDFDAAYNSMVAPLRQKLAEESAKAREEQIRQEVREEMKKEFTLKGGALPTDDQGSAPEMSALTRKIADRKKVEVDGAPKLTPGALGEGVAGQDAYQAYLRDQAAGRKPVVQ